MITQETLHLLSTKYHTSEYPNTVREYCQHLFLAALYKQEKAQHLLFKGGMALRIVYMSPRFSEDLDFSLFDTKIHERQTLIEDIFQNALVELEGIGLQVQLGEKFGPTTDGYFGIAQVRFSDYPPVNIEINISSRNGRKLTGNLATVANDFVPVYNLLQLPQEELVEEKIFGALLNRHKARDFYDLYFIMRKGLLTIDQKHRLSRAKETIARTAAGINFNEELSALLPADQHLIIKNFSGTLLAELDRQVAIP